MRPASRRPAPTARRPSPLSRRHDAAFAWIGTLDDDVILLNLIFGTLYELYDPLLPPQLDTSLERFTFFEIKNGSANSGLKFIDQVIPLLAFDISLFELVLDSL